MFVRYGIDLVAEKARRLEIDYRGSDSGIGRTHRRDGLVLSRDGNVALYQAKRNGRNRVEILS